MVELQTANSTPEPAAARPRWWRSVLAGPAVAVLTSLAAIVATSEAGVPLRDPGHVGARRFLVATGLVALFVVLDLVVRAARRSETRRPSLAAIRAVRRERWGPARSLAVAAALVSFYVTYLAYRNLKSVVPLLRPDVLMDRSLADLDRSLFAGHDPAALLHTLLGTGISAHFLSAVYGLFFLFVPLSLAVALVLSRDLRAGLFFVTALSINWALAAGSYYLLPSLGPIYAEPTAFADLPTTGVTHLQTLLLDQRTEFLRDPAASGTAQSIGAFASLHVSIFFTAALATHAARARAARAGRRLDPVRPDRHRHDLPRLALRPRRRRRHDHRGDRARARPGPHRLRPAHRQAAAPGTEPGSGVMGSRTLLEPTRRSDPAPSRAAPPATELAPVGTLAQRAGGPGHRARHGDRGADRDARRGRPVPRSRPRRRAVSGPGGRRHGVARVARHRHPRRSALTPAHPDARADAGGPSRALDAWRAVAVGSALVSFYVTYLAYRNLKAIVPLLRPGDIFDRQLADLDRSMFGGHDPAALLHSALGIGIPTHVLSTAYAAFIVFLPLSLAVALVFSRDLRASLFYASALSVNWVLGAVSYFLLPSLGPIYFEPAAFAELPHSEVTRLQDILLDQRVEFLLHPATATPQSIAAFASLHISMSLTAALAAHLLGLGRRLTIGLWIWFTLTTLATVYLGWHYVLDDFGGLLIAAGALALARALTGIDPRVVRRQAGT